MAIHRSNRRVFAIGDIHGCARELEALIHRLKLRADDEVVFLGDYVDRGPDSRKVIDTILELSKVCSVVALKGNHEALLLDFLDEPESQGAGLFVMNGGTSTLANYTESGGGFAFPEEHVEFIRGLSLFYETKNYFFVHAGVPEIPLAEVNPEEHEFQLLWSRQPFLSSTYRWGKTIVHGHTPVDAPEVRPNRINVDTGCVYDRSLTAIELPSRKFHSVERMDKSSPRVYPRETSSQRISVRFSGQLPLLAQRPGEAPRNYETLNYNEAGLLMRENAENRGGQVLTEPLRVGDLLEGVIGDPNSETSMRFRGVVVRLETRGSLTLYGVRIEQIVEK